MLDLAATRRLLNSMVLRECSEAIVVLTLVAYYGVVATYCTTQSSGTGDTRNSSDWSDFVICTGHYLYFKRITMKAVLEHPDLSTMEQIISVRILRFLEKVAPSCREVDLLGRCCAQTLNPFVDSNEAQGRCLRGSLTSVY